MPQGLTHSDAEQRLTPYGPNLVKPQRGAVTR
jgi:hypothetical protein